MVITLNEQLTIQQVSPLLDKFKKGLEASDILTIDVSAAREVDSAFLQLLCAVKDAAARDKKEFALRLAEDPDNAFAKACRDVGLERLYL